MPFSLGEWHLGYCYVPCTISLLVDREEDRFSRSVWIYALLNAMFRAYIYIISEPSLVLATTVNRKTILVQPSLILLSCTRAAQNPDVKRFGGACIGEDFEIDLCST